MTAAEVKAAAKAGELGDLEAFDPSEATVNRCARALRAEREGQTPADQFGDALSEGFAMAADLAREIRAEQKDKGKLNPTKVRQYAQTVRLLGMSVGKGKPEPEPDEPSEDTEPTTPALLARLAGQGTSNTSSITSSKTNGAAGRV